MPFSFNGPPDWLRNLYDLNGGDTATATLPPLVPDAQAPIPQSMATPVDAAASGGLPDALTKLTNIPPPNPPPPPMLPDRTDVNNLTSFQGDIHQRYQPLIDMAVSTMMHADNPLPEIGPGVAGHVMPFLSAIGQGLDYGTRHLRGLPTRSFGDNSGDEQKIQLARGLAAGNLLNDLSASEEHNQAGLKTNVGAWSGYRQGLMDPRAQEFKNLKEYGQAINPLSTADARMERLPDLKSLDAKKGQTEAARRGLIQTNADTAKQTQGSKVDKAASDAENSANRADISGAQSDYADETYKAKLDHEIAATDALKTKIQKQNGSIATGKNSKQWAIISAADKDLPQLSTSQRQYEKMLHDEQKASSPDPEIINSLTNKISNIVRAKREAQDARKQAIESIPVDGSQLASGARKPGLAEVKTEASPTPLPDGKQVSQTPGLDATPKGSMVAAGPPKDPVVGQVYQSPNGPMKFLGGDQWQRQTP